MGEKMVLYYTLQTHINKKIMYILYQDFDLKSCIVALFSLLKNDHKKLLAILKQAFANFL